MANVSILNKTVASNPFTVKDLNSEAEKTIFFYKYLIKKEKDDIMPYQIFVAMKDI